MQRGDYAVLACEEERRRQGFPVQVRYLLARTVAGRLAVLGAVRHVYAVSAVAPLECVYPGPGFDIVQVLAL